MAGLLKDLGDSPSIWINNLIFVNFYIMFYYEGKGMRERGEKEARIGEGKIYLLGK